MEKHTQKHLQGLDTSIHEASHYHEGHVGIQSFSVHTYDDANHETGLFSMQVAYPKNQDVIDIACFYEKDATYYIATNISIRPILHARKHLVEHEVGNATYDGLFQEGVGIIYSIEQGDISIIDAVQRALRHKLGLDVDPHNVEVGNPYFPSIGGSGETCIPCFAQVTPPVHTESYYLYGHNFEAERKIEFLSIDTIIQKFFLGEIEDMRLVLLAYDLAYKKGYTIPSHEIHIDNTTMYKKQQISDRITVLRSLSDINTFQSSPHTVASTIELFPEETVGTQFLKKYIVDVKNTFLQGNSEEYKAEMIVREGVDTVDMGGFFWKEGKLYLVCKESLRPSVQARNLQPHYIHAAGNIWDIEGTYASLCHPLPSQKEDICTVAKKRLQEKVGMEIHSSLYVGSYFPSIGNNAEKVHLVLQAVDPSIVNNIASERDIYKPRLCAIEIDMIIHAYHQGILRDPRLVLIAYILKNIMQYENIEDEPVNDNDRRAFQQAIHQPLQVDMFMKTVAQKKGDIIYDLHVTGKKYSVWYRRLVSYIEQELGGFLGERNWLLSETDEHFFSAMLPIFAVPSEELASKYINYITHDQGHYLQGDIIPYYPETNTRMNREDYIKYMSWTEANAVFDSDYLYPMQMGLERFEGLIGGESVATSFHKLGIYNDDEVRKAIISIERDGIIPDAILLHPEYNNVRNNIVDRVLRFHIMDELQASLQYDKWQKMPYVARIALQFCNTTNSIEEFNKRMNGYHDLIRNYDEGVNTLKAYVSRIIVKHISLPALHIATAMQSMADNKIPGCEEGIAFCEKTLATLLHRKAQTEKTRDTITSMVANDTTIKAVRYANYIRMKVDHLYNNYQKFIEQTPYIDNVQKDHLKSSRIPYFTGFATMPDNLHEIVIAKEQENLARVQQ